MGRTSRVRNRLNREQKLRPFKVDSQPEFIELCKWMTYSGGWNKVTRICPAVFPATGRGLMALENIPSKSLLVKIPGNLLVTKARVLEETPNLNQFNMTSAECLTFFILHSRIAVTNCAYLATLPQNFSVGGLCHNKEVDTLPSTLQEKVLLQKEYILRKYDKFLMIWEKMFGLPLDLQLFQWAWFSVNTRAVFYQDSDQFNHSKLEENNMALAPYLDMFNHDSSVSVKAGFNPKTCCYEIRSNQTIRKYEQVFINYGPHNNQKLFLEYGFITPNNPHNAVEFDLRSILKLFPYRNIHPERLTLLKQISKNANLFVSQDGLSWDAQIAITILISEDSRQFSYLNSPFQIIPNVSKIKSCCLDLIQHLINELKESFSKADKFGVEISSSFSVAKLLIQDMIRLLNQNVLFLENR